MKKIAFAALSVSVLLLSACTNIQPSTQTPTILPTADTPLKFAVTGKIGVVTTTTEGRQAGSAFYTWTQEDDRFAI